LEQGSRVDTVMSSFYATYSGCVAGQFQVWRHKHSLCISCTHTYWASWLLLDIYVSKQSASALGALIFSSSPERERERERERKAMTKERILQRKWPDLQPHFFSTSVLCFFLLFFLIFKLAFIIGMCSLLFRNRVIPCSKCNIAGSFNKS